MAGVSTQQYAEIAESSSASRVWAKSSSPQELREQGEALRLLGRELLLLDGARAPVPVPARRRPRPPRGPRGPRGPRRPAAPSWRPSGPSWPSWPSSGCRRNNHGLRSRGLGGLEGLEPRARRPAAPAPAPLPADFLAFFFLSLGGGGGAASSAGSATAASAASSASRASRPAKAAAPAAPLGPLRLLRAQGDAARRPELAAAALLSRGVGHEGLDARQQRRQRRNGINTHRWSSSILSDRGDYRLASVPVPRSDRSHVAPQARCKSASRQSRVVARRTGRCRSNSV